MGIDFIGDIHGHVDRLEALLSHLGYEHRRGAWQHPARTVIFVGDLIDRGPGQLRTLHLVRHMIDRGSARTVMGNHEFNAIGWATPDPQSEGLYFRPRHGDQGVKNQRQHAAFLAEVGIDSDEHRQWVDWFLDMPLWIEEPEFRVVHACWVPASVAVLRPYLRDSARLGREFIEAAHRKGDPIYRAVDVLLKGVEVELPDGFTFTDKDGHRRSAIRTRWWDPGLTTYRSAYIGPDGVDIPDIPLPAQLAITQTDRPTFVGHYWLNPSLALKPMTSRVACLDYSVAKGGPLVAYRFDGEQELSAKNFVAF